MKSTTVEQINFLTREINRLQADITADEQNIFNARETIALMKDARLNLEAIRAQEKLTEGIETAVSTQG